MDRIETLSAPRDPRNLRRRHPLNEPLPATMRWVANLPDEVRPMELLKTFPRIANALARVWSHPAECRSYLEDLIVDRRGNRNGFPAEVLENLLTLRDFYLGRYPQLPLPGHELSS